MSVQVRRRREAAPFLSTFVGAQGELIVDTTNNRVQVHDGTTPGGFAAAKLADIGSLGLQPNTAVNIDGGTIDGAVIGGAAPVAGSFTTLAASGLSPFANIDINGGTIDGTVIGATTQSSGKFTTINTSGQTSLGALLAIFPGSLTTAGSPGKLQLFSNTVGLGVSTGSFDYCTVSGSVHSFYVSGTKYVSIAAAASTFSHPVALASYTVATLPAPGTAARMVFCSNARMMTSTGVLETAGAGSGGLVTDNGTAWKIAGTNITASS